MKMHTPIGMAELASMLGWSTRRTREHLVAAGVAEKRGGRYVTTAAKLAAHYPEVFQAVVLEREGAT